MDVAVDHAGGLELDALLGVDRAPDFAADDGLAADDVAFHFPAPSDQHLLRCPDRAAHRAFYFYDAVGRDVAHHAHTGADDG
jgi:hypothetical protein